MELLLIGGGLLIAVYYFHRWFVVGLVTFIAGITGGLLFGMVLAVLSWGVLKLKEPEPKTEDITEDEHGTN